METRTDIVSGLAFPDKCPVCHSPYLTFVKNLPRRVGGHVALYYCMECESACSPFSPPSAESNVTAWHLSVHERNMGWASDLFNAIDAKGPIIDIGSGIGSLLFAARERGMEGIGFDLNPWACKLGRERFGLDLRDELWTKETSPPAKTITCISVLEHVHQPRQMIFDLVRATLELRAQLFLSVPFFTRAHWPQLLTDNLQPGHYFEVPHSHVTHFSKNALENLCKSAGAENIKLARAGAGWSGLLIQGDT